MVQTLTEISSSNSFDMSFASSFINGDVIQANICQADRGFDEDAEFLEILQSVANQFDDAFRRLAD